MLSLLSINPGGLIAFGVLIVLAIIVIVANIKIVPQATVFVVERLGTYYRTWETGLHFKMPFVTRIAKKVSLKEQVVDFRPQPVITRDNVTLRNIIGELELDHTLTSRDVINSKITTILDTATDKWGIKVNRVELKNIIPPAEIQDAMEKQMKAERERREAILRAEGVKRSQILEAEGRKESQILVAEAEKQAAILRADAVREQKIREAQGEAEAIHLVQRALADSITMLNEANPNQGVLALKGMEAFSKAADGKATKIIIPSELQSLAGLAASFKSVVSTEDPKQE